MTSDDETLDPILAAVAGARTYDVSERRARRLRHRCHAVLRTPAVADTQVVTATSSLFRRTLAPALAGMWCVAYLVEIVRRAMAVYFGTQ